MVFSDRVVVTIAGHDGAELGEERSRARLFRRVGLVGESGEVLRKHHSSDGDYRCYR
ncbi:hypothetical protein ACWF99_21200 [Nocardia sp. NPDC055002]